MYNDHKILSSYFIEFTKILNKNFAHQILSKNFNEY